jgi:hypothetical protein
MGKVSFPAGTAAEERHSDTAKFEVVGKTPVFKEQLCGSFKNYY